MRRLMLPLALAALAFAITGLPPAATDFESAREHAERLVSERSWKLALEAYERLDPASLDEEERRWVAFRRADLRWRSAPETADPTIFQESKRALEALLRDDKGNPISDRVSAEVFESLGDMHWLEPRRGQDWGTAWQNYVQALDWWAGARDLAAARDRYLGIVWKATESRQEHYPYGYYGQHIPVEILENAVEISLSPNDRSHANYLLAMQLANRGDANAVERTRTTFDAAIDGGRGTEWYDDALFHYAQWLSRSGSLTFEETGQFRIEPDFESAVAVYRRYLAEFSRGASRYWDQAKSQLDSITQPSVNVSVSNVFLPGSEITFGLSYRNVPEIELSLTKVDLTRDVTAWSRSTNWIQAIDASRGSGRQAWKRTSSVTRRYAPGFDQVKLDRELAPGAWLLEARAGSSTAREVILVSQAAIVTRTSGRRSLVWVTDARSGAPLANASVSLWQEVYEQGSHQHVHRTATTDGEGIAEIPFDARRGNQMVVFVNAKDHQAFAVPYGYYRGDPEEEWRIYATTDRPAYRPGETSKWKITARVVSNDGYTVPAQREVTYEISDPRGTSVSKGKLKLNDFGSAWTELALTESMALGPYQVTFQSEDRSIGSATLFRLEEYKLPEFRVEVRPAGDGERKKLYRPGDRVEVIIEASYYFGGPVANATVEAAVYQSPYYRLWLAERDYPWYFEQTNPYSYYRGGGEIVKREVITTDSEGRARLSFDTPVGDQDYEYRIEAKVTDASRREITASDRVRVTRAPYFAEARPGHWIYQPGDPVEVNLRTVDSNDQPVQATGMLRVTREEWIEVWLDPKGNEITGRQLEAVRARGTFPPPREPGKHPWTLIRRGYEQEEIAKSTVTSDKNGRATYAFTPQKEGYYRVAWSSRPAGLEKPRPRDIVNAETAVWVATNATTRLGYFREGGVEIVLDQESVRPGATVPVMLVVPTADRHVLFSVEHDDILTRQIVRTSGNVKLIQLQLGDQHIPNVFLTASMVMDLQLHLDTKELIVPPVEKFLTVDLKPDRDEYQPREAGTVTVTTRDASGKPVRAEVSLAVADESVFSIQEDFAGDPRPFFYGRKRQHAVQTASSFMQRPYIRLVDKEGQLVDDRLLEKDQDAGRKNEYAAGMVGGARDLAAQSAVAEAVTVTANAPASPRSTPMKARADAKEMNQEGAGGDPAVQVRSDFRSTLFWQPDLVTDANGTATVKLDYADSLTTWRATARAATTASQFGIATSTTRTKKPLIVRLQAPRFFVVGDQTVVSAVINNNTAGVLTVAPSLDASGLVVTGLYVGGKAVKGEASPIEVASNSEARVDWVVAVKQPGTAKLRVTARAGQLADAMERSFPVEDHGIDKLVAVSGKIRADEATLKLALPAERRSTSMVVQVTPSIAVTMLDALPYLIDYPYGCTEQTMSRFLPAVVVSKTLADLGISRETVASRLFGGIEQAHAAKTHPDGKKDLQKLDAMVRAGLSRLYDFQHADGGWGWWKDGDSDHFMSAYVVWGLAIARDAGIDVRREVLDRGTRYLVEEIVEEELSPDRQAWMLHAISASKGRTSRAPGEQRAFDNLWNKRDRLSSYGLALFALSAHQYGLREQAVTLARNLENAAAIDKAPDASILVKGSGSGSESVMATAHWGARDFWWRWHEGPIESTATTLRALSAIDPKHRLIEPSMNWLVKNRRGAQWSNTRDTALAVLALNDYLRASGELAGDLAYEVSVNGTVLATESLTAKDVLSAPSRFDVPASAIRNANEIRIRRTRGSGPLYVSAESRFFSLEEPVKAAGNEIFLKREYTKMVGRPTLLKGYVYDRVPMRDGESIRSGERVEVVLTVEVKNDYEYLLLEDLKPAGLEAVELVSGEPLYARQLRASTVEEKHGGRSAARKPAETVVREDDGAFATQSVYRELRDRKVALFIDRLSQGIWEIRYTLRAEVPGTFHALPLVGGAMYVPEIRGNSDEMRITVEER